MEVSITYQDLIQARTEELRVSGKSEKTIQNAVSYLRRFMRAHECSELTAIGLEWDGDFSEVSGDDRGMRASLRAANKTYLKLLRSHELPQDFGGALRQLLSTHGATLPDVARNAEVPLPTLRGWVKRNSQPKQSKSFQAIHRIEEFFRVPEGTLTNLVYKSAPATKGKPKGKPSLYALNELDAPDKLREEIHDLLKFKTCIIPQRGMVRNGEWRLRNLSDYGGYFFHWAAIDSKYCPTAALQFGVIRGYLGFLVLHRGCSLDQLSLAYLASIDFLHSYMEFLAERNGWTPNISKFLGEVKPLLHPVHGYITQCKHLAACAPFDIDESDWSSHCKEVHSWIGDTLKLFSKSKQVRSGRNPFKRIQKIIDLDDPLEALLLLYQRLSENHPPNQFSVTGLTWARDRVLIALMMSNPLRINQFKAMTYREDGTGHLRFYEKDGKKRWSISFQPHEFKNEKGAAKKEYHVPVPDWVGDLIDDYLQNIRPHLLGADDSDWVFLRAFDNQRSENLPGREFMMTHLEGVILKRTSQYLPEFVPGGFKPHAVRHIVATGMLKQGYTIDEVAAVLHDTVYTVRKHYGQLAAADGLRTLSRHLDKIRASQIGSRAPA